MLDTSHMLQRQTRRTLWIGLTFGVGAIMWSALAPLEEAKRHFERDYLVRLLKITGGNVTQAATLAKRNRTEFYKLLQRHHLEPAMFKGGKL